MSKKAKKGELVKPFTFETLQGINEKLIGNNEISDANRHMKFGEYIHALTRKYAELYDGISDIKGTEEVWNNENAYVYYFDMGLESNKMKVLGMKGLFWYTFYQKYLDLVHTAYSIMAYEYGIDGCKYNDMKNRFMAVMESENIKKIISNNIDNNYLDNISRIIQQQAGKDYRSLDTKTKLDYFKEYLKIPISSFIDELTVNMATMLSQALFDALLYDEDIGSDTYQIISDQLVEIINGFKSDLTKIVWDLAGIYILDYVISARIV